MAGGGRAGDHRPWSNRASRDTDTRRRRQADHRDHMRVLAFDTATALTAVALRDVGEAPNVCLLSTVDLAAVADPPAGQRPGHAQRLLALINELLTQDGGWEGVDRIAVGVGPGTFTGLRIGVGTAHALARSTARPLVGGSPLR